MGERIKLKASDGFELTGYRAVPEGKPRGGVVVIQEVWGVNHWIQSVVDRWARHGFLAVAPGMFDRVEYGFESENYGQDHFARVGELMKSFNQDNALLDVAAAVKAAAEGGKVGITGYCFGGRITWRAAAEGMGITAGSGYYGGGVPGLHRPRAEDSARDALWQQGQGHSARAGRGAEEAASERRHLCLRRRPRLL